MTNKEPALFDYALQAIGGVRLSDVEEPEEKDFWVIPGFITRTNTLLYGEAGAGKSFLVCHMIKALLGGGKFLGVKPLDTFDWVLILAVDAGARFEYRKRLGKAGVPLDKVTIVEGVNAETIARLSDGPTWPGGSLIGTMTIEGNGLVVIDHASGVIEGEINDREPWVSFWRGLVEPLAVPVVVVGHSTSKGRASKSKTPMGHSAAIQFARGQVHVWGNDKRNVEANSRDKGKVSADFRIVDDVVVPGELKKQERSKETLNRNHEIAKLAVETPGELMKDIPKKILAQVNALTPGKSVKLDSLRKTLGNLVTGGVLEKAPEDSEYRYIKGPKFGQ